MAKNKGKKEVPPVNTASLPDLVFTILFFFMSTTSMREVELRVRFTLPEATETQKLEKKGLASYIYIGPPVLALQAQHGTAPRIQLNDAFRDLRDISEFIASQRDNLNESDRAGMTVMLKADQSMFMGTITDVKQELRKANALSINYAATKGAVRH